MSTNHDHQETFSRLDELWAADEQRTKRLCPHANYAILSDFHLGNGRGADNFRHNEEALIEALQYYRQRDFSLILLGDVEELWQFDFEEIRSRYDHTVYQELREFPEERVYRVFGNHDFEWGKLTDRSVNGNGHTYWACEAVKLGDHIIATHGHQGEDFADEKLWWLSRFGVRLFRYVEPISIALNLYNNSKPLPRDLQTLNPREKLLYQWAKARGKILICGHTHRAIFQSLSYAERLQHKMGELKSQIHAARRAGDRETRGQLSETLKASRRKWREEKRRQRVTPAFEPDRAPAPCYYNSGCGLYTEGLTNLEIENRKIRLVKWTRKNGAQDRRKIYLETDLEV